jgi:hypothetical protein
MSNVESTYHAYVRKRNFASEEQFAKFDSTLGVSFIDWYQRIYQQAVELGCVQLTYILFYENNLRETIASYREINGELIEMVPTSDLELEIL